ncbi:type II/IV secretion system protein [Candidatus Kaiserbacteria bacterium]|nr:MAG: type II/IV secretion system protein [Candidatus Kaiserbacteria bacterium]
MATFDDSRINTQIDKLHHTEEERLLRQLAPKYGYPYVNLSETKVEVDVLRLFPEAVSTRFQCALFAKKGNVVSVAISNPKHPDIPAISDTLKTMGLSATLYLASHHSITQAWAHYHDTEKALAETRGVLDVNEKKIEEFMRDVHSHFDVGGMLAKIQGENNVDRTSRIIEILFGGALALWASDVHIEPEVASTRVRYRLDGVLMDVGDIDRDATSHIISRIKLLAGVKLNVRNIAQDGRFTIDIGSREIEIRTSVIPGAQGESIVMRLLDQKSANFSIDKLGLSPRLREIIDKELKQPNGAIVTTGPTGSGKTTALYSFLKAVSTPEIKIITLEDPVEYKLEGVVHTPISSAYSFASGLRAILRQDPDVILVGEIRDREVMEAVVHAALTGHLVFSTLHTNSAAAAFARLIDMGMDSRMFGSAFNIILGQRLVRVLCDKCKVERNMTTEELKMIQRILEAPVAIQTVFDAKGCEACGMNGYKGRVGVFEAIQVDEAVENVVLSDSREVAILAAAKPQGIPTMQQDGLYKALAGMTTLDELERVLGLYVE